jgi:hypothetical protein
MEVKMKNKLIALLITMSVLGFIYLFCLGLVFYPSIVGLTMTIVGAILTSYFSYKIALNFLEKRRSR